MPSDFKRVRYILPKFSKSGYRRLMKTINNSLSEEVYDVACFRQHVLEYYYKYGPQPTMDAFNIKKSCLYNWINVYEKSRKNYLSLIPKSTRPKRTRRMLTDVRLIEFIRVMRETYGNVGKDMIKPFLDEYAKDLGIKSLGLTTIGKLIKRRRFFFEPKLRTRRKNKYAKLRTRKHPKVTEPGYIQMDCVTVYVNQQKHLFMCVIDIYTKFALVVKVKTLSSLNAREVFKEFMKVTPTKIHTIQTDNGSEFLDKFHKYLDEIHLKHVFIYPHSPKINGVVERFNRTIQEEFINRNDEIYYDEDAFKVKLTKYLEWYNFKRPHSSLNYMSPINFIKSQSPISR